MIEATSGNTSKIHKSSEPKVPKPSTKINLDLQRQSFGSEELLQVTAKAYKTQSL